ncbi:hypothetical protein Q7P37_011474 [Cladosporium fusiforme]
MPTTLASRETLYKIASIPGDGIGVDITHAAQEVLNTLADCDGSFRFAFTPFDWSSKAYLERGWYMPEDAIATLKTHDAIYFGAVGWPSVPDHISLWNMILPIRKELNQFVNVRPTRILAGTQSPLVDCQAEPKKLDWVIVRENSEGEYAGQGGTTHGHEKYAVATELAIFTYVGIERIMRFAFETAKSRPRRKLTMVTKSNAQRHGMVLWDKVFYEVAKDYEGVVEHDKMLVDAMTVRMVNKPESLDVIVATNYILSDLAAALAGSIGIAPSSNLNPSREFPSMFEPIHGSAPDIAGKGIANPIGAFWSAAEMVRWVGAGKLDAQADALMLAIENVTGSGVKTRDLGGEMSTQEVTRAVVREIERIVRK